MRGLLLAGVLAAGAAGLAGVRADDPAPAEPSADEKAVLAQTNKERKAVGAGELKFHPTLMKVSRGHAATMAKLGKLAHDAGGKSMAVRIRESGYRCSGSAENIAQGYPTAADVVAGWMSDPPHKKNLLDKDFTEMGAGVATGADGAKFWAQDFGTPPAEK